MKNIHVLPTDKSSRLSIKDGVLILHRLQWRKGTQNIYITSDEEIKEGYFLDLTHNIVMKAVFYPSSDKNCKKIILTTDQDLIADGVQAIDDEFLEWFVKNPSCEFVKIIKVPYFDESGHSYLIIPKEEPYERTIQSISLSEVDKEEPKQESLSWDELIREAGSEEQLMKILKLPHIAPLVREAMRNECKK